MKIIFTKSAMPLSVLIRWLFPTPNYADAPSHVAVVFDDELIIQSNLYGVIMGWFPTFLKSETILLQLDYDLTLIEQEAIYRSLLNNYDGDYYDFGALFYFFFAGLLHKFFGTKMPTKNLWKTSKTFLCTELISKVVPTLPPRCVAPSVLAKVNATDFGITTPYEFYQMLKVAP